MTRFRKLHEKSWHQYGKSVRINARVIYMSMFEVISENFVKCSPNSIQFEWIKSPIWTRTSNLIGIIWKENTEHGYKSNKIEK